MLLPIKFSSNDFSEEPTLSRIAAGGQHILDPQVFSFETLKSLPVGRAFIRFLTKDFEERGCYLGFREAGFDLGISVIRDEHAETLLDGATLVLGIYPRTGIGDVSPLTYMWLAIPSPGSIHYHIEPEVSDPSGVIWDFIAIGFGLETSIRQVELRTRFDDLGHNPLIVLEKKVRDRFLECALQHLLGHLVSEGKVPLTEAGRISTAA